MKNTLQKVVDSLNPVGNRKHLKHPLSVKVNNYEQAKTMYRNGCRPRLFTL